MPEIALGEAKTINGRHFESADRALTALDEYGCLHYKKMIIYGVSEPRYTDEELAELNAENAKEIEIDGVKKTGYEWKQTMRRLETDVRKSHCRKNILKAVGDKEGVKQLEERIETITEKYKEIAKGAGMKPQLQRMSIVKVKNAGNTSEKVLTKDKKDGIMESQGGKNMRINNIDSPIEQRNTGKGNPNAIIQFERPLNNRQKRLLNDLQEYDSKVTVSKKDVNMKDLSALTAHTGDEFAMFTKGHERLIIRGASNHVNIDVKKAKELSKQGYKWSGHTHPGTNLDFATPSQGDRDILNCFSQQMSAIYNSKGQFRTFEKE